MRFGQQVEGRSGRTGQLVERSACGRGRALGDVVDVAGEPGQYRAGPHRIKGQQPHRRAGRPRHRLVRGNPRRVPGTAPGRPIRPIAWESEPIMEIAPMSCRMSSAAMVEGRIRDSANARSSGTAGFR